MKGAVWSRKEKRKERGRRETCRRRGEEKRKQGEEPRRAVGRRRGAYSLGQQV